MKIKRILIWMLPFAILCISMWIETGNWMIAGRLPEANGKNEYAVILGAKVNGENPSLSLRYRLEAALDYAKKHPNIKLILSGGQGPDEDITEAEAMRRYLAENGIDEDRLILETASTSTYENIQFSKKLLPASIHSVTIITSDYHLARAREIARKLDLESDAVAAKTPKVVEWKLTTRERLALLKTSVFGK
ncbi:YdcF family protein [Lederbergia panacisoli]|uniref:YdcF family protein n=1 Tax=Lederbergia panacisoli TaxID=1255251 RepID=UPI00214BF006|nr:YdcF family protein [Lederbergia panacisoli]MCR2821305.1 YdcF family protein [Lederbergia panacisoli]